MSRARCGYCESSATEGRKLPAGRISEADMMPVYWIVAMRYSRRRPYGVSIRMDESSEMKQN